MQQGTFNNKDKSGRWRGGLGSMHRTKERCASRSGGLSVENANNAGQKVVDNNI
jgi:hypothetical protein